MWELTQKPTLAQRLKTDRVVQLSDIRVITHESRHEPDERVIKITLELTANEIKELEFAIENHVKHMRKSNWVYSELKTVQRLLGRAYTALFDSNK